jgi:hypothetical protein
LAQTMRAVAVSKRSVSIFLPMRSHWAEMSSGLTPGKDRPEGDREAAVRRP